MVKKTSTKTKTQRQKKRRKKNTLYLTLTAIFLVLVLTWSLQVLKAGRELDAQILELTQQRDGLIESNEAYHEEIDLLNTTEYIEQLARDKLGLVREGEVIVAPKKEN